MQIILRILEWSATAITLIGALFTTFNIFPFNVYLLSVGSILWVAWAILSYRLSIAIVNTGMLMIYLYGALKEYYG
mgnify:CR=1 FL=1